MVLGHPSCSVFSTPLITSSRISAQQTTRHRLRGERGGRGTTTSRTTTMAANELSPPKSACAGDTVLRTRQRTASHSAHFYKRLTLLKTRTQMAAPRPEHAHATDRPATVTFPSRPAVTRTHDNWKSARQTSCRQQTAPPQQHCSKDVTAHLHWP